MVHGGDGGSPVRLLVAELRKMLRPLTGLAALALILLSVIWAAAMREAAYQNLSAAESGYRWLLEHPTPCRGLGVDPGPECERLQREERERTEEWLGGVRAAAARVRHAHEGIGAGVFAAGMVASAPGALIVTLLAAAAAGGEWSRRTVVYLLLQQPRRHRVVLAKLAAAWVTGLALLLLTWLALSLGSLVLRSIWPLPALPPAGSPSPFLQAGRAAVVILAFASIGTLAGIATRSAIGGAAAGLGALAASLMLANLGAARSFTFARWVEEWMGFRAGPWNFEVYYVWTQFLPAMSRLGSLLALLATVLVLTTAAVAVFQRTEA
jgi:ABC-type transport system involved in multi-copper enzyme maturation permease subunit